jgi:HEAT repeat protein
MNQFNCPHCGQNLQDEGSLAGQTVACPICGQMFRMPGGPQPYVAPAPAVQPSPPPAAGAAAWAPPAALPAAPPAEPAAAPPADDDGADMSLPFEVAPASVTASRVAKTAEETQGSKVMLWAVIGGMGFVVALVAVIFLAGVFRESAVDDGGSDWSNVIARLESEDSDTRREAADAILRSGPATVVHALKSITEIDGDRLGISENGCNALASMGSEIVGPLTGALHSDSAAARAGAARVLREMGSKAKGAAAALGDCLDDNQRAVRLAAADTLINLGPDAAPAVDRLAAALTNSDSEVRRKAIRALRKIGPGAKSAVPALNMAARTAPPDYTTQKEAKEVLKVLDPDGISAHVLDRAPPEIQELFQTLVSTENPADERATAARTLGGKGHEAAIVIPALYKILRDEKDKSIRLAAAEALGNFGAEAYYIVPGLYALTVGGDREVVSAASAAMKRIDPKARDFDEMVNAMMANLRSALIDDQGRVRTADEVRAALKSQM